MTAVDYSMAELAKCALREAGMRRRVYPGWVAKGRMSQQQADLEIDKMESIAVFLEYLAEKERLL